MYYFKLIPYIAIITLLSIIVYLQYTFQKDVAILNNQIIESKNEFADYKMKQKDMQLQIIKEITDSNNKRVDELNEAINKINAISNNNRTIINQLRTETITAKTNYDSFSEATRKHYNETISELFGESTSLLVEFAEAADRSTEAALIYNGMLTDQYNIVNKYNQEIENK